MKRIVSAGLLLVMVAVWTAPAAADKLYWVDGSAGSLNRANLDGSQLEQLAINLNNPQHKQTQQSSSIERTHSLRKSAFSSKFSARSCLAYRRRLRQSPRERPRRMFLLHM